MSFEECVVLGVCPGSEFVERLQLDLLLGDQAVLGQLLNPDITALDVSHALVTLEIYY